MEKCYEVCRKALVIIWGRRNTMAIDCNFHRIYKIGIRRKSFW